MSIQNSFKCLLHTLVISFLVINQAQAASETIYYHHDALGSIVASTDEDGEVKWREEYQPYGEKVYQTGAGDDVVENPDWYTGKHYEPGLDISYFGARWYDAKQGRFLSIDPAPVDPTNTHTFNRYAYANNNPYKYVDPDGRASQIAGGLLVIGTGFAISSLMPGHEQRVLKTLKWLGSLHNESSGDSEEGCIYCVSGDSTSSGNDYIGSSDDFGRRKKENSDGRDRSNAEIIDKYKKGDRESRRRKEQQAINDSGGVDKLDNKRNEVAPKKWEDKDITPPSD